MERDRLGGTCLNRGCIPSKALLETADLLHRVTEQGAEFGLAGHEGVTSTTPPLGARRDAVVEKHVKGVEFLMKKNKRHRPPRQRHADRADQRPRVAAASPATWRPAPPTSSWPPARRPARCPASTSTAHRIITSDEALARDDVPKRVTIVGRRGDRRRVGEHVPRLRGGGDAGRVPGPRRPARGRRRSARSWRASSASAASPSIPRSTIDTETLTRATARSASRSPPRTATSAPRSRAT